MAGGKLVSKSELAAIFGTSKERIAVFQREGMPYIEAKSKKANARHTYNTAAVHRWLVARETTDGINAELERAKLAMEQTRSATLKNDLTEGKLINLEAASFVAQRAAFAIRQRILTLTLPEDQKQNLLAEINALGETDFSRAEKEDDNDATEADSIEEAGAS